MTQRIFCAIKGEVKLLESKSDKVIKKIIMKLKEILKEDSDFTGSITINFCLGGISNISKKENLKV